MKKLYRISQLPVVGVVRGLVTVLTVLTVGVVKGVVVGVLAVETDAVVSVVVTGVLTVDSDSVVNDVGAVVVSGTHTDTHIYPMLLSRNLIASQLI